MISQVKLWYDALKTQPITEDLINNIFIINTFSLDAGVYNIPIWIENLEYYDLNSLYASIIQDDFELIFNEKKATFYNGTDSISYYKLYIEQIKKNVLTKVNLRFDIPRSLKTSNSITIKIKIESN